MRNFIKYNGIETIDRLARLVARDTRTTDIVAEIGCSKGHVYNLMKRAEFQPLHDKYRAEYLAEVTGSSQGEHNARCGN